MKNRLNRIFTIVLSLLMLLSLQPFQLMQAQAEEASKGFVLTTADGTSSIELTEDRLVWLTLSDISSEKQEAGGGKAEYVLDLPEDVTFITYDEEQSTGKVDYDAAKRQVRFHFEAVDINAVFQLKVMAEEPADIFLSGKKLQDNTEAISTAVRVMTPQIPTGQYTMGSTDKREKTGEATAQVVEDEKRQTDFAASAGESADVSNLALDSVVDVSDWEGLILALANVSVSKINIVQSFAVPDNPLLSSFAGIALGEGSNVSGGVYYFSFIASKTSRPVVIEGKNIDGKKPVIDFGALTIRFYDASVNTSSHWDLTWENLTTYHGNWYGFMTYEWLADAYEVNSILTYKDLADTGNQMLHSVYGQVFMEGEVVTLQESPYTSGLRTNWAINDIYQCNLHISNLTLRSGATFTGTTLNSGNVYLMNNGSLILEEGAVMTLNAPPNAAVGEAIGDILYIVSGNVELRENAILNLNSQTGRSNEASLYLATNSSKVEVGDHAQLNINSAGHTGAVAIVYLNGAELIVNPGGSLDIQCEGMGSSGSSIIYGYGVSTFIVHKKGSFNVVSDSTSLTNHLIYFTDQRSIFQFEDAQKVNLQKTKQIATGTANGLIYMAGTLGLLDIDVQSVKMWARDNMTDVPTESWTPIFKLKVKYNTVTPTVNEVSSLTQNTVTDFKSKFTTRNVQRVLFEYIPDVELTLDSTATDDRSAAGSRTVSGTASPGAYIRLSDTPYLTTDDPAIDPQLNSVQSPVTNPDETDPKLTDNFTIQAGLDGRFSFTLPAGSYFTAASRLKVYAFLNGKDVEVEQTVVDETAPIGTGVLVHAAVNEVVPTAALFVTNPQDTNPANTGFTYDYQDSGLVAGYMNTAGDYSVVILLKDDAQNVREVTADLKVHAANEAINGEDIALYTSEIEHLTEAQLKSYVILRSGPTAQRLDQGQLIDLTNKIIVANLGGLTSAATNGVYQVKLQVPKSAVPELSQDLEVMISVRIVDEGPTKPVDPENPVEGSEPPNGAENKGTGNTGLLRLDYIPEVFSFGTAKAAVKDQVYQAKKPKNTDDAELNKQWVQVSDDRMTVDGWSLTAKMTAEFSSDTSTLIGGYITLPEGKMYNTHTGATPVVDGSLKTGTVDLTTTEKIIFAAQSASDAGKLISTKVWDPEAVSLKVNGGTAKPNQIYKTTINWTITNTPAS